MTYSLPHRNPRMKTLQLDVIRSCTQELLTETTRINAKRIKLTGNIISCHVFILPSSVPSFLLAEELYIHPCSLVPSSSRHRHHGPLAIIHIFADNFRSLHMKRDLPSSSIRPSSLSTFSVGKYFPVYFLGSDSFLVTSFAPLLLHYFEMKLSSSLQSSSSPRADTIHTPLHPTRCVFGQFL